MNKSFCRIGLFYDGTYFVRAQNYFYGRQLGWLNFSAIHTLIENFLREKEQGYSIYKVVYAGWYQGLYTSNKASEHNLRLDRNRHIDLMHTGIEPKFVPMSESQGEKGVDVALAVDVMQIARDDKIDIAVLLTGDGDFVPLVRALMKQGIRVGVVYFDFQDKDYKSFINNRLLNVCNYSLNINSLESNNQSQMVFRSLFRQSEIKGDKRN